MLTYQKSLSGSKINKTKIRITQRKDQLNYLLAACRTFRFKKKKSENRRRKLKLCDFSRVVKVVFDRYNL